MVTCNPRTQEGKDVLPDTRSSRPVSGTEDPVCKEQKEKKNFKRLKKKPSPFQFGGSSPFVTSSSSPFFGFKLTVCATPTDSFTLFN